LSNVAISLCYVLVSDISHIVVLLYCCELRKDLRISQGSMVYSYSFLRRRGQNYFKQEAQLMLTTGTTRLAVIRGQQTFLQYSTSKNVETLKSGSQVTQCHWKWQHSIDCVWFPISVS